MSVERSTWQRFIESDFFFDFKRSPVTIVSFTIVVTPLITTTSWLQSNC